MSEVKLPLLLKELKDVDWKAFGRALETPEPIIRAILQQNPHSNSRCWIDLMDHWMDNSNDVSWATVAKALEKMFQKPQAERIIRKYCIKSTMQMDGVNDDLCDSKSIEVHGDVEEELVQLNLLFSEMIRKVRSFVSGQVNKSFRSQSRRIARQNFIAYVATYLGKDTHGYSSSIDKVLDDLCSINADLFKVEHLKKIICHHFKAISTGIVDEISVYEYRVKCFMKHVRISQLKEKVIEALPNAATDQQCDTLSIVLSHEWNSVTWNLLEKLMKKVFHVHDSILIHPIVTHGSVKVQWSFRQDFKTELVALARESITILEQSSVIELSIGGFPIYPKKEELCEMVQIEGTMAPPPSMTLHDDEVYMIRKEIDSGRYIQETMSASVTCDIMAPPPSMTLPALHDDEVHMIRKEIESSRYIQETMSCGLGTSNDMAVPVFERSYSRTIEEVYCSVDFQCDLESMNPKYEICTIKEHIDIVCPSCEKPFTLEESSSIDHLKCHTCNHEFCGSCCESYQNGKEYKQASCSNNTVHVHHSREYCSYLHELPIDRLEKILTDNHIHYQSYFLPAIPSEKECSNTCKKTRNEAHGICSLHYKVYLTALMKENGIDISEELARLIVQPADVTTCSVI